MLAGKRATKGRGSFKVLMAAGLIVDAEEVGHLLIQCHHSAPYKPRRYPHRFANLPGGFAGGDALNYLQGGNGHYHGDVSSRPDGGTFSGSGRSPIFAKMGSQGWFSRCMSIEWLANLRRASFAARKYFSVVTND